MKKKFKFWIIISLSLYQVLFSQIIIVRKDASGNYGSLTQEDIADVRISKILWKYTWPSCIAQDLTEEEKKILLRSKTKQALRSEIKEAEENFIKIKIQEISKDLDVVFVPNTLYELFLMRQEQFIKIQDQFDIDFELMNFLQMTKEQIYNMKEQAQFKGTLIAFMKNYINQLYNKNNEFFFKISNDKIILSLKYQQAFINWLLFQYREQRFASGAEVSDLIYQNKESIKKLLVPISNMIVKIAKDDNQLISQSIDLDYFARNKNEGLLFRGSSLRPSASISEKEKVLHVLDTALHKNNKALSISFGNSLFAGSLKDQGACVYHYLLQKNLAAASSSQQESVVGYALTINKFEYINNYISNLFFISAFCLEAGLVGKGEFFHSRTKPAVLKKNDYTVNIEGINPTYGYILDPLGIFLITRDPYKQAKLFSDYMVKNGTLLQEGNITSLSDEEAQGLKKLFNNQKKLTAEYKLIEFLNSKARAYKQAKFFPVKHKNQKKMLSVVAS